jgi:hypothetical protein
LPGEQKRRNGFRPLLPKIVLCLALKFKGFSAMVFLLTEGVSESSKIGLEKIYSRLFQQSVVFTTFVILTKCPSLLSAMTVFAGKHGFGEKRVKRTAGYNSVLFWGRMDPKTKKSKMQNKETKASGGRETAEPADLEVGATGNGPGKICRVTPVLYRFVPDCTALYRFTVAALKLNTQDKRRKCRKMTSESITNRGRSPERMNSAPLAADLAGLVCTVPLCTA